MAKRDLATRTHALHFHCSSGHVTQVAEMLHSNMHFATTRIVRLGRRTATSGLRLTLQRQRCTSFVGKAELAAETISVLIGDRGHGSSWGRTRRGSAQRCRRVARRREGVLLDTAGLLLTTRLISRMSTFSTSTELCGTRTPSISPITALSLGKKRLGISCSHGCMWAG